MKFAARSFLVASLLLVLVMTITPRAFILHPSSTSTRNHYRDQFHNYRIDSRKDLSSTRYSRVPSFLLTASTQILEDYQQSLEKISKDLLKVCKVKVAPVSTHRWGLVATQDINKGDTILGMPYDNDRLILSPNLARKTVFAGLLPDNFDSWTGDAGLVALLVLNELARSTGKGIKNPERSPEVQDFMSSWIRSLPTGADLDHPLLWSETDQEILQASSNSKIYRVLDDIEEDFQWLLDNVFEKDRERFPEHVEVDGSTRACYTIEGFRWAMATVQSRSYFLEQNIQLLPVFDMCNHLDDAEEVKTGFMGTFGTTKGAQLVANQKYKAGEEVFCSYGPKSAADYLLEHGFCPEQSWKQAVSELTFEVDPEDRFYDDKLDILEFETYDQAPMDPVQSFDVISAPGRDGQPDPAMIQFVRLCKLGGQDAFLLESIFRKEVWGFMELPVSEKNEALVVDAVSQACQQALDDFASCPEGGPEVCKKLRESESRALTRTLEFLQRDKEALDLKEYYQERRLKDLGLDSEWTPEDDFSEDLGFGQTRAPGAADYDW